MRDEKTRYQEDMISLCLRLRQTSWHSNVSAERGGNIKKSCFVYKADVQKSLSLTFLSLTFVSHTECWEAECTVSGYQRASLTPFKGYTVETISYPTVNITTDPNDMHLATFRTVPMPSWLFLVTWSRMTGLKKWKETTNMQTNI